ncbi:MAG: FAD-dependent oxidoreductase [Firmicutes bacterium]|nr:FAD-dependent oxidoreductase [Bacillota bacterium]
MAKIYFSSWNGRVIDDRAKEPHRRLETTELNLPEKLKNQPVRALIGWGGLVIVDPKINIVQALKLYFEQVQEESCGRCVPCRVGSRVIAEKLGRLVSGKGTALDLQVLTRLGHLVKDCSLCQLGQTSPVPLLEALKYFEPDFKACLENGGSVAENLHFQSLLTTPCQNGCPAHIDIYKYIGAIGEGRYREALAVIRDKTPLVGTLGRVCVHPCEDNCRRGLVDEPLSIRVLKRFVADEESRWGAASPPVGPVRKRGKVAVIGSGPAGLNAAYHLAGKGYAVTIFEALPVAGGMLAVGIPAYRLPREILKAEIDLVRSRGVTIKLNTRVGDELPLEQLWEEGFGAIFIATGLHRSSSMRVDGEEAGYRGFIPGVEFLRRINLGEPIELGERVAVIGGGNVAMDCARSSLRLGAREVNLVYRRSRAEMPANEEEIIAAEKEGVSYHLLANPVSILAENNRVVGMECIRMKLGEPDSSGRRRPVPVEGSEFVMEVDTIVPAIGQVADLTFLGENSGVGISRWGLIEAEPINMATARPGIFAGGDVVLGARTVIEAVATGNRAAEAIDNYLSCGKGAPNSKVALEHFIEQVGVFNPDEKISMLGGKKRQAEEARPVSERLTGFSEVELGFKSPVEAVCEAERCAFCLSLGVVITELRGGENCENS